MTSPIADDLLDGRSSLDREQIEHILKFASVNVLRVALYHQTKDPSLAAMPVKEHFVRGGALSTFVVPKEHHHEIRQKAADFLSSNAKELAEPSKAQTKELITLYTGKEPNEAELDYGFEELGFAEFPRNAVWKNKPPSSDIDDFKVTIIGSGFSGMAMAIQLDRLGIAYRMIERLPTLGGTWHINDYPEARVDVPSFSYQYKFEKDYPWNSFFAPQKELLDYANHIADKYQINRNISFSTSLKDAKWNAADACWDLSLENASGEIEAYQSNIVISASGLFGTAKIPDIPGIDRYKGEMFHTTQWNHDFDYQGKNVAIIGTGSTGTQLARDLGLKAAHLSIFQRTANWVTPINGYHDTIPPEVQWLLQHMPGYRSWFIYANSISEINMQDLHELDPEWVAGGGKVNAKNQQLRESLTEFIRAKVSAKPELFDKLVPNHSPMSRRLVIDNSWYDTLLRDNVELVSEGIKEITETGIIDNNDIEHAVDLIVLGAGFKVSQYMWPVRYQGVDNTSLEQAWAKDGARAFKSLTVPGFPNFFMMYGPNAQARAGSFHSIVECLARYIGELITHMLEQDQKTIEVTEEAYSKYNQEIDAAMQHLLWEDEQGGGGYYVNEHGRAGVIMPWRLHDFYQMIDHADIENYRFY